MNETIKQYWQRFQLLSQREQLMVLAVVLASLWGGWDSLLFTPVLASRKAAEAEISSLQTQAQAQQLVLSQLQAKRGFNPNDDLRGKISKLQQSVDNLKQQLNKGEKKFVSPDQMATALSDMLKQNGNLKLTKLETLPVSPFVGDEKQKVWVYRHGLELTLEGDFFSTLEYLKTLERLPWRIQWDQIDYSVKEYPRAETRIQVYTLSFEQDWLGV